MRKKNTLVQVIKNKYETLINKPNYFWFLKQSST